MIGFPRQHARTRRYTLGVPRSFTAGSDGDGPFLLFLRTETGDDPVTHLWRWTARDGATHKLVDARTLALDDALPVAERARRERAREMAGGITAYATDDAATIAAFALGGRLFTVDVASGTLVEHESVGDVFDPRPSPEGARIAYHGHDGLHVVELDHGPREPGRSRPVVAEPEVAWGRAEFVAAEEMGRDRGFWWSGDGARLAVARVDERAVDTWTIADPATPWSPPVPHRYPAAGSTNADVSLWIVELESGRRTETVWDRAGYEYLARVRWGDGPLTLLVQPRDQRSAQVLTADPADGHTRAIRTWEDEAWVELVPGSPRWCGDRLVTVEDRLALGPGGTRVLCLDGEPVTPAGLQVRELVDVAATGISEVDGEAVITFLASGDDPTQVHVYELLCDRHASVASTAAPSRDPVRALPRLRAVTGDEPGVHRRVTARPHAPGTGQEPPVVDVHRTLDRSHPRLTVRWSEGGTTRSQDLEVVAATPVLTARPRLLELGARRLRGALFLPEADHGGQLPVLLDPYGGPHGQRVVQAHTAHLTSQWLADQGFAVLVVDGRGSPARGPRFERGVHRDLATPVLDDQVDALHAAAELEPRLDLTRVGIRGWSFGGYLAALAVLRRPDVFRAGIAGAPVTDWHLYDTHYTERYLGDPVRDAAAYAVSGLVDGNGRLLGARPWDMDPPPGLLLIHGLADDNVVAAHALRLSSALLADGRSHRFLPLSGVTHMTPQEVVAEHLLTEQVAFLRETLVCRRTTAG